MNLSVEHVLMFALVVCALYYLMDGCDYKEGFNEKCKSDLKESRFCTACDIPLYQIDIDDINYTGRGSIKRFTVEEGEVLMIDRKYTIPKDMHLLINEGGGMCITSPLTITGQLLNNGNIDVKSKIHFEGNSVIQNYKEGVINDMGCEVRIDGLTGLPFELNLDYTKINNNSGGIILMQSDACLARDPDGRPWPPGGHGRRAEARMPPNLYQ